VDTFLHWSGFGQFVVLLLIQLAELRSCGVPYLSPFSAGRTGGQLVRPRLQWKKREETS